MKVLRTLVAILTFTVSLTAFGQDITGQWNGLLNIPGSPLRLAINITKTAQGYTSTLDSPDQGAYDIPVDTTLFMGSTIKLTVVKLGIQYKGEFADDSFKGTFIQGGMTLPLDFSKDKIEKTTVKRPQEPQKPYPYLAEDVSFQNVDANISLAGTLTMPKEQGKYPAVVLITGSGPQDRNEEIVGHKPFLIISDYLTKNGIAVLRFDDRGIGQSTGDFASATSVDFASDVKSAIAYLKTRKEIDVTKIGLVGHSEGGMIAPMVAAECKDIDFIVLMAGPGISGDKLLSLQGKLIEKASGISEAKIKRSGEIRDEMIAMTLASKDINSLKADLRTYLTEEFQNTESRALLPQGITEEQFISMQINFMATPWMANFLRHDPATVLGKVDCAVLAINGEKDLQVPPKENLTAIDIVLKKQGNKKVTVMEFPNLNHLFQECETGSPNEYGTIEETFSPVVLTEMTNWILKQVQ
ncbi:alpha/beta hydrolase family protein [Arenibacter palladensis]|uniref:alpha/beta hydrolase family protein n=1 Tax=Arenibacter palladensis TaxID=237373 RepID=UPI0026E43E1E|nr:alpha/beta hydrolase [Arenibacter palladensis]MDO6601666.1 alpha/beta fold hydrolase [Arenibacter palladensis]